MQHLHLYLHSQLQLQLARVRNQGPKRKSKRGSPLLSLKFYFGVTARYVV